MGLFTFLQNVGKIIGSLYIKTNEKNVYEFWVRFE